MPNRRIAGSLGLACWLLLAGCGSPNPAAPDAGDPNPYDIGITLQWGSDGEDGVNGAAVDADGNLYLTGYAMGAMAGNDYAGSVDVFLSKVGEDGALRWTRQYGTESWDQPFAVAVDPQRGDIYVTGGTMGDLAGYVQIGAGDVFLSRFTASGDEVWTRVWGTPEEDIGYAVTVDSHSTIYVVGWTAGDLGGPNQGNTDSFLTKLDRDGNVLWSRQWGNQGFDDPAAAATDSHDDVYITGKTAGSLDGNPAIGIRDVFLTRFAGDGTKVWSRQYGHGDIDCGRGIAISGDDAIYLTGYVIPPDNPDLAADVFLTRVDVEGEAAWTNIWGTYEIENGWSVAVDSVGDVLVTGKTMADLEGNSNAGGMCGDFPCADVYLTKTSASGERLWTRQWGSDRGDAGSAVAVTGTGTIFVAGVTTGDLGGPSAGSSDAFVTLLSAGDDE